jgi:hypothetical protein
VKPSPAGYRGVTGRTFALASVFDVRYFVAAQAEVALRVGVRGGQLAEVTDLVPRGPHHAVGLHVLDVTVCGQDVDRPLTRFLEHDFDEVRPEARCPDCDSLAASA